MHVWNNCDMFFLRLVDILNWGTICILQLEHTISRVIELGSLSLNKRRASNLLLQAHALYYYQLSYTVCKDFFNCFNFCLVYYFRFCWQIDGILCYCTFFMYWWCKVPFRLWLVLGVKVLIQLLDWNASWQYTGLPHTLRFVLFLIQLPRNGKNYTAETSLSC